MIAPISGRYRVALLSPLAVERAQLVSDLDLHCLPLSMQICINSLDVI